MNQIAKWFVVLTIANVLQVSGMRSCLTASEMYAPWAPDAAKSQVVASLHSQQLTDSVRSKIDARWSGLESTASPDQILEAVVESIALADLRVKEMVQESNSPTMRTTNPRHELFDPTKTIEFHHANVSLYYGRRLVERRLYDEAWEILKTVKPQLVVDPGSLFFFQAVAAQGVLEIRPALEAIDQLLTNTERVPVRYSTTAALMKSELSGIEEKSLDEIARLMADSERRLDLGRAGEKVQDVQERIISSLDEMIKKNEQQQSGGGGAAGQGAGGNQSLGETEDSKVKGSEGKGETDKKTYEHKGNWGNLPEKELTKAKNNLNKNFPSHYEQAIEKYTKKLATRTAKKK